MTSNPFLILQFIKQRTGVGGRFSVAIPIPLQTDWTGIEPALQESKSCVLPLNHQPIYAVSHTSEHFHAWSLYAHRQPLFSMPIYLLSGNILRTLFIHVAADLVKHILMRLFFAFSLFTKNLLSAYQKRLKNDFTMSFHAVLTSTGTETLLLALNET